MSLHSGHAANAASPRGARSARDRTPSSACWSWPSSPPACCSRRRCRSWAWSRGDGTTGTWSGDGPGTAQTVHPGTGRAREFQYSPTRPACPRRGLDVQGDRDQRRHDPAGLAADRLPRVLRCPSWRLETFTKPAGGSAAYSSVLTGGPQNCSHRAIGWLRLRRSDHRRRQAGDEFVPDQRQQLRHPNVLQGTLKVGLNTVVNGGFEQLPVANTASYDTSLRGRAPPDPWRRRGPDRSTTSASTGMLTRASSRLTSMALHPARSSKSIPTIAGHTYRVAFGYLREPR